MTRCDSNLGLCYNANAVYSTYFLSGYDVCPETGEGAGNSNQPQVIDGVRMWFRTGDLDVCASRSEPCPTWHFAKACPAATDQCGDIRGLCTFSTANAVYSTYFLPEYDVCPETGEGAGNSNQPQVIMGDRFWLRGDDRSGC